MQMAAQHALPSTGADHAGLPGFMAGLHTFAVLMGIRFALPKAIINDNRCNIVTLSGGDREAGHPLPEFVRASGRIRRPSLQGTSTSVTLTQ
jgi:hypothetical protein